MHAYSLTSYQLPVTTSCTQGYCTFLQHPVIRELHKTNKCRKHILFLSSLITYTSHHRSLSGTHSRGPQRHWGPACPWMRHAVPSIFLLPNATVRCISLSLSLSLLQSISLWITACPWYWEPAVICLRSATSKLNLIILFMLVSLIRSDCLPSSLSPFFEAKQLPFLSFPDFVPVPFV